MGYTCHMDDIRHIRCSESDAIKIIDEMADEPYKRIFGERSDDGTWHLARIDDATWACVMCDSFNPWEENPAKRCTKGHCLDADDDCPSRTTVEVDEIYGEESDEEHRWLSMDDLDLEPPTMKTFEEAYEDYEVARLRANLCLNDPDSYSIEEKAVICREMQDTQFALDEAMKLDIRTWPPVLQESFIKKIADDVRDETWWWRFLME